MEMLYKVPRKSRIGIEHLEIAINGEVIKELNFSHIDGMYSFCTDDDGNVINLRADTKVEIINE